MRRGMQGHVAAPRGPTRRLRDMMRRIYIYLYIVYNIYSLPFIGRDYYPSNSSHLINPILSLNFLRVGLSSTKLILMQVMWPLTARQIDGALEIHVLIA